jgi:hypothetical protein
MTTFIAVYHSGVVITNEIGIYEFVQIKKEIFFVERICDTCKCDLFGARAGGLDG